MTAGAFGRSCNNPVLHAHTAILRAPCNPLLATLLNQHTLIFRRLQPKLQASTKEIAQRPDLQKTRQIVENEHCTRCTPRRQSNFGVSYYANRFPTRLPPCTRLLHPRSSQHPRHCPKKFNFCAPSTRNNYKSSSRQSALGWKQNPIR